MCKITTLIIIIIIVAELDRVQSTETISRLYTHASEIYYLPTYLYIVHTVDLGRFRNRERTGRRHDNNNNTISYYNIDTVRDDYFSILLLDA